MSRSEDRQVLRALGWRGSKAKRRRKDAFTRVVRPDLAPYREPEASDPEE